MPAAVRGRSRVTAKSPTRAPQKAARPAPAKAARRAHQAEAALWADLGDGLIAALRQRPAIARRIPEIEARVRAAEMTPMAAARQLLALFLGEEAIPLDAPRSPA